MHRAGGLTWIHVVFVRIAFLALIIWTAGLGLLGYWILASSIPEAQTADGRAAAHGQPPFNAQELIDRAKQNYASFTGSATRGGAGGRSAGRGGADGRRLERRPPAPMGRRCWAACARCCSPSCS